jgi:alpha-beta hydrolase superfamily lysophospholipase
MPDDVQTPQAPQVLPDVLGDHWVARTIPLRPDHEGEVSATLVYETEPGRGPTQPRHRSQRAVLYLHGFVDYFFQAEHAAGWTSRGYDFYALDLRKYGRSLRPGQTPNYVADLRTYDEEIDEAIRVIRTEHGHDTLVLLGHSAGGLVAALWADRHRKADGSPTRPWADALVLNSPWFDLNGTWFEREVLTRLIDLAGPLVPRLVVGKLGQDYGRSLHVSTGGAWEYDLSWKPIEGFPVRAGWLRAIRRGHRAIARGLGVDVPVLVCCSTASGPDDRWHEAIDRTDSVLDVEDITTRAVGLGPDVTVARIQDGIHDLALSGPAARQRYEGEVFSWIAQHVHAGRAPDPH